MGRKTLEELVDTDNYKKGKNDVEEERYGDWMTGVPDDLHLNDPVAVNRDEKESDENRFEGDSFDQLLLHF